MQPDDEPTADVEIVASAAADELRFHAEPEVRVSFPGTGARLPANHDPRKHRHAGATRKDIPVGLRDDADQQPPGGRTRLDEGRLPPGDKPGQSMTTRG